MRIHLHQWFSTLLVTLSSTALAGGLVWSDRPSGTRSIRAGGFDGSNVRTLYAGVGDPRGVIIDTMGGRIYFTDRFGGTATSGEINSIPTEGGARTQHLGQLNRPADLCFDASTRSLYWCEENGGLIRRAQVPLTGGTLTAEPLFSGLVSPYFLDFDAIRGRLYWGTNGGSLLSGPIGGGVPDAPLYTTGQNMRGVCVDSAAGMVYWVERDGARVIRRRAIEGGPVHDLYTGLDTPHGLVLDLPARKMYWVDTGSQNAGGFNPRGVSRGHLDGAAAGAPEIVVAGTASNQPWDLALDPQVTTYDEWTKRFFRLDASADLTRPLADPDGDGLNNFGEYALGTAPLSAGAALQPTTIMDGAILYPAVTYARRFVAGNVVYAVAATAELGKWSAAVETIEVGRSPIDAEGMEYVTVRSTTPVNSSSGQFFRLTVTAIGGG